MHWNVRSGGGSLMNERRQLIDILNNTIEFSLTNLHTAAIAKVTGVQAKTISVRPVVNRVVNGRSVELPEFTMVPPVFLQGGGSYTAHPIAVGDYCLLVLTERCFDRWYDGADFQDPAEFRMHDYSDGLAIVGVNPLVGAITIPTVIQQTGDTNQDGNYTHQGDREQTGDYTLTGTMSASVVVQSADFSGLAGGPMVSSTTMDAIGYKVGGTLGVSGTFTTITVVNGLVVGGS